MAGQKNYQSKHEKKIDGRISGTNEMKKNLYEVLYN